MHASARDVAEKVDLSHELLTVSPAYASLLKEILVVSIYFLILTLSWFLFFFPVR